MRLKYASLVLIIAFLFLVGCSNNNSSATGNVVLDSHAEVNIDKLEIYHFHATRQCYSCKTVGAYAEETIQTYFNDELDKGLIVFDHINIDVIDNTELVKKYGATGSSLWIGIYDKQGFHPEVNSNVWYKIGDKAEYMNYLKGIIEQKLAGN